MSRAFSAFLLLTAAQSFAQDGPSFDCDKAASTAEKLICAAAGLAFLDVQLAERFAAALNAAQNLDVGASEAESELRAIQRGWIKGRDECWKANDARECVELAYLRRDGELVALWLLEEPTGIAFWSCDGNPANEVVTYFFATELPSVRFERFDSVDAGSLTRTASGSRYEGSFGRFIWIKGEEATYRDPDPDATTYTCVLRTQD